eukprot:gene12991-27415_t
MKLFIIFVGAANAFASRHTSKTHHESIVHSLGPSHLIKFNQNSRIWPCGDELDKKILQYAMPAIINLAIFPLTGAVETLLVGRMGNALALGGQGVSKQYFSSLFFTASFLPSIVTSFIASAVNAGDLNTARRRLAEGVFIASLLGIFGSLCLYGFPHKALSLVLSPGAPALQYAQPYLSFRALTFLP